MSRLLAGVPLAKSQHSSTPVITTACSINSTSLRRTNNPDFLLMPSINLSLFKNERKERDNQPDFTGPGQITKDEFLAIYDQVMKGEFNSDDEGRIKVRVAGWKKQAKSGTSYISLAVSVDDYNVQKAAAPAAADAGDIF